VTERDRQLAWHGIAVFALGLLTGLIQEMFTNPRMGLAAHLEGVMNGTFLLALSGAWPRLRLSPRSRTLAYRAVLAGTYGNWAVTVVAAILGTSAMTPIASTGFSAGKLSEFVATVGFVSVGVAILAASALLLLGFRGRTSEETPARQRWPDA
jgi:hydroxylaminobenzene mutase